MLLPRRLQLIDHKRMDIWASPKSFSKKAEYVYSLRSVPSLDSVNSLPASPMTAFTASKFSQTILRTLCILYLYCPNTCFARLEQEDQTSKHNYIVPLFREHQLGRREGNKFLKSTRKIISVLGSL